MTVYDVQGLAYSAVLKDGIPFLDISDIDDTPKFSFLIKVVDRFDDFYWLLNGKFHRLDGPAVERKNGNRQ